MAGSAVKTPEVIKFRYLYGNMKIFTNSIIITLSIYLIEILLFVKTHSDPMSESFFSTWVISGAIAAFFISWALATMRSVLMLTPDKVVEKKGYVWGLFHSVVHIPWEEFASWDKNYIYIPNERKSEPQINLYYKNGRAIRVNKRTRGGLWVDESTLKWDAFSKHLTALFDDKNIPCETPKKEKSKRNIFIIVLGILGGLLLLSLIGYMAVSMWARPEVLYVLVLAGLVIVVVGLIVRKRRL
jgi:hypothetical protein